MRWTELKALLWADSKSWIFFVTFSLVLLENILSRIKWIYDREMFLVLDVIICELRENDHFNPRKSGHLAKAIIWFWKCAVLILLAIVVLVVPACVFILLKTVSRLENIYSQLTGTRQWFAWHIRWVNMNNNMPGMAALQEKMSDARYSKYKGLFYFCAN